MEVELIDRVDEAIRERTGVPADELGFQSKVEALLAVYEEDVTAAGGATDGEPTVHPEVAQRLREVEAAVVEIVEALQAGAEDDHATQQPSAAEQNQAEAPGDPDPSELLSGGEPPEELREGESADSLHVRPDGSVGNKPTRNNLNRR
ncbi:hypothetical protein ACFQJD_00230 [Haloplanus sp. GCM10025708]